MKHFFLAVALLCSLTTQAQPAQWNWVQPVEGSNPLEDIAADAFGNLYATGTFTGFLQLGGTQLSNPGLCLYVAKFTPAGQLVFATKLQVSNTAFPASLAVDNLGNSYITGVFSGTLRLGNEVLATSNTAPEGGGQDIMTLKLAPNGTVRWLRQISSIPSGDEWEPTNTSRAIAVDAIGNSYLTGSVSGNSVQFGSRTFSNRTGQAFIASYSPQGALRWANVATGLDAARSEGVHLAIDDRGKGYMSGSFYGGSFTLGGANLPASAFYNDFLAQFNLSQGQVRWAQDPEGTEGPLAVDRKGHVYRAGQFTGTVAFGKTTLRSTGNPDIFVARYNSQGQPEWATALPGEGPGYNYPEDMAVDAQNGKIYLTGIRSITSDFQAFIALLQPNGKVKHVESVDGPGTSSGFAIALAGHDNLYNSGIFTGTAQFGPFTLSSAFTSYYLGRYGSWKTVRSGSQGMLAALTASVYPMPAHEQFTLRLDSREKNQVLQAVLYNQLGIPIAEKTLQNATGKLETVFDTSQLPPGLYVLRLKQNGQLLTKTVTVE
jgi:hypothetical protein